ncbi:MAG: sigma-70 family RNA polymerase sigma factor [Fimbriimonadales bacterium]
MTATIWNERDLIRKAAGGCRHAFDELVERHYRVIYSHAYRMMRNADDAADATQVTFVKAHRSLKEFDQNRPLRPWLLRICTNACTDIARGRNRGLDPIDKYAYKLESDERPEQDAERSEIGDQVRQAVERLPEKYRRIIVLRHYEHLEVEEIADRLGAPEGTVKSWLFRARAILKKDLQPTMAGFAAA